MLVNHPGNAILAIDQGTTSSRALVFDRAGEPVAIAQQDHPQLFPDQAAGWVEHDPEAIWSTTLAVCRQVLEEAEAGGYQIQAVGITNQRETVVIWERDTGRPIHHAIVWQDRRTMDVCRRLAADGHESMVAARTGLPLDPYFSASKIAWILDQVPGARRRAAAGELACGTVDSFLLWRLTGGAVHATDATNASRTSLFDIHRQCWDEELLDLFRVPAELLPEVYDCAADFGATDSHWLGPSLPILGVAGDQQAAAFGQACFHAGDIKSTYGTGCFIMAHTGDQVCSSEHRLLSTVAYRLAGHPRYALEGAIFSAGSAVQWLRDGLGVIGDAAETEALAASLPDNRGVYLVSAFTGLGAPHWRPDLRGALFGLSRATGPAELARAALESVVYQTSDLLDALGADGVDASELRVDGGMVANDWLMQFLADITGLPVQRPAMGEITALGAARLAAYQLGWFDSLTAIAVARPALSRFEPKMDAAQRRRCLGGWKKAVETLLNQSPDGSEG